MNRKVIRAILRFYLPVGLFAVPMLFPLYWLVASALKGPTEIFRIPPTWYPHEVSFEAFRHIFAGESFLLALRNSLIVSFSTALLAVLIGLSGGYALARLRFPLRSLGGLTLLFTQLFPAAAILIPLYLFWSKIGLHASFTALVVTYLAQAVPLTTWLLKGYLETIPRELEEQGFIDGAGRLRIFFQIMLPLAAPAIGATFIFAFIGAWNEFLFALAITGTEPTRKTLPVALVDFIGQYGIEWDKLMAAASIATVPSVLLFLAAQRFFVRGLTAGAVKG